MAVRRTVQSIRVQVLNVLWRGIIQLYEKEQVEVLPDIPVFLVAAAGCGCCPWVECTDHHRQLRSLPVGLQDICSSSGNQWRYSCFCRIVKAWIGPLWAVACSNWLTFRHRASCTLGQAFHYSPENAFYIFNQQIYFIIWYLLDRASLI